MEPLVIASLRLLFAGIIMMLYVVVNRTNFDIRLKDFFGIAILGIIGLAVYNVGLIIGIVNIDAGTAAFIISQTPVFSIIFAVILLGEMLYVTTIIGMILCIVGMVVIYLSGANVGAALNMGVFWILLATISQSLYFVLQKKYLRSYTALHVTAYGMIGAAIPALLFLPFIEWESSRITVPTMALIGYLAIFPSLLAYFLWSKALQQVSVVKVTNMLYLLPILTILQSFVFLNETPGTGEIIGGFLGLLGAFLAQKSNSSPLLSR